MTDKYVVIGANGQLGSDLVKTFTLPGELIALTHKDIDVCEHQAVRSMLVEIRPSYLINLSAFHKVDICETEVEKTFAVNAFAVGNLAKVCEELNITFIHFSTDYVFSGKQRTPRKEMDTTDPVNVYGASKRAGESLIETYCSRYFIFRVCGLYGTAGSAGKGGNFVETMLRLASEKKPIRVVNDQILTPTYTRELAQKIWEVITTKQYGLYHCTNNGECSWYDFTREIFRQTKQDVSLSPQTTAESGAKARRPPYSVLDHTHLKTLGMDTMSLWQDALGRYLTERKS